MSTHASVVPETFVALDWFREVVTHLFDDWSSSLSSSFVIRVVFVAFTARSRHVSPQDYATFTPAPIRAEDDDVSTRQHETMNFYLFRVRLFSNSIENGVVVHVRRLDDDESFSFREFIVTKNKKTTKKRGLKSRRQSVVKGEHRESRSRRFVLFAFLFPERKSRIIFR